MITTINNKHNKLNVPNLRLKEFQGEWITYKIKDVLSIGNGRDYKHLSNGEIPVFGTGGYMTSVDECLYDGETTFIGRKGSINKPFYYNGKFWTVDTLFYTHSFNGITPKFTYCLFQTINWLKYNEASGVPSLSKDTIEKIKINIPGLEEQNKIAKLMFVLDERIATQNKIIEDLKELKSAISKKLLCNDKWTTYKIQDIAEIGRGRVISSVEIDRQKNPLYPVYSSQTSNNGIMGYLDNYMFDGEYITWTTDGANAGTVFYRKGKFNCTNVCGTLKIQPKFDCYFVSLVLQQATQKYVSSNLANPKLMNNTMASIKIRMPNIETQKQLSKVFQTLDSCLLVHQRTCKMYLSEKQYLLCQMFI
ncbi:restriction endonuclease subunit S [Prevotella sp.]|uniref:restriction endonuclease subunit S n=1 Tax=Prevotella sp. TaxID=59823 RepID=UPI0027E37319|nr:restriction endonuclease subunit S [Prevotella sp.]